MKKLLYTATLLLIPGVVLAQVNPTAVGSFRDVVNVLIAGINQLVAALIGVALMFFLWGIVRFLYYSSNEKEIQKNKGFLLWGVIALFLLGSLWGVVNLMCNFISATCRG